MEANAFLEALYNANYERLYIYAENLLFLSCTNRTFHFNQA